MFPVSFHNFDKANYNDCKLCALIVRTNYYIYFSTEGRLFMMLGYGLRIMRLSFIAIFCLPACLPDLPTHKSLSIDISFPCKFKQKYTYLQGLVVIKGGFESNATW